MYQYNKYITRHLVHSMLLITLSLTSIVWLTQALRFIDVIVNQGVSIMVFLTLTVLLVPSLILMILPPALLCSVLFVYNKLKIESELVVMQAAGLSRWRLGLPAIQVAAGVAIIGYFIAMYLQPVSYKQFKEMQFFLRNNYASILLQDGVFNSPVPGLTVFIRERDENNILHGILVHDARTPDVSITMMAEEGKLVETAQGPRFLMVNGNRQEKQNGKLSFLNFEKYTLDISLYTKEMGKRYKDPQELFLHELFRYDDTRSMQDNLKRYAEGHQRILWPAYSLCITLVALAVLLSGEFNRRGHWRRIAMAVGFGVVILFASVGFRGMVAMNPSLVILAYLNLFIPCIIAAHVLSGGSLNFRRLRHA
ncbi:MAG: LPS export ABC transporter permease LptF [Rickettsiales bacterium]